MFLDKVKITCKAGNGGDGMVNFHREKYIPQGGPDGGDGGNGGSIYFTADPSMNTLISFKYTRHFKADNGDRGLGNTMFGKKGEDIEIKVPRGTVIKDAESGKIIADIFNYDEKVLVLKGGKGGRGNAKFCTPIRRSPNFAENGEVTVTRELILELKTIADVGLVGFPNVGKSTLLSVISAAKPKIANYHFTTLSPNLGVVKTYIDSFVVADIPGLIEGAAEGLGLGHDFLRHIERVRLIVHLIDISGIEGRNPVEDYYKIRKELNEYSEKLSNLPEIVVLNKCDLLQDEGEVERFIKETQTDVIKISAVTKENLKTLINEIENKLQTLPKVSAFEFDKFEFERADTESFEITRLDNGAYSVTGGLVDDLARRITFDDEESFRYFQRILRDKGVIDALRERGVQEGDTIKFLDLEFDFVD